jgi:hypothetical protein
MLINGKKITSLNEDDLKTLINDKVPEGKNFEYKINIPSNSDRDKKEFLADVSSFSNSAGGYLFFGIVEKDGVPIDISELIDIDQDAEKLRFENLLRDSIAPRLSGVSIQPIPIAGRGYVIAMHIPKSWNSPHMVTFGGTSKFYSRNSAGKYQLDVYELQAAFNSTNVITDHLRSFRMKSLERILGNEIPIPLPSMSKVILQLIPFGSLVSTTKYDLIDFQIMPKKQELTPIAVHFPLNPKFNFEGLLTTGKDDNQKIISYLQLYRNGIVESVDTSIFTVIANRSCIDPTPFTKGIIEATKRFFNIQNLLETEPPYFLILTLLGTRGFSLPSSDGCSGVYHNFIDRNDLVIQELVVDDLSLPPETLLRPAFDAVWNSAGLAQSPFYDSEGNWTGKLI